MAKDITEVNLANLSKEDDYIKMIKEALVKAVGQDIVLTEVGKVKRTSGVSSVGVLFVFTGNQKVELFVRASADVFKATVNGKVVPLFGDFSGVNKFTFDAGVNGIAKIVREGQSKFEASLAKEKIKIPGDKSTSAPKSVTAQLKALTEQESLIDQELAQKEAQKTQLLAQIEQAKLQKS